MSTKPCSTFSVKRIAPKRMGKRKARKERKEWRLARMFEKTLSERLSYLLDKPDKGEKNA